MVDEQEQLLQEWYDHKSQWMVRALGPEHDMVLHADVPYAEGGGLDLYYYGNGIPGTAIATKELSDLPGEGSASDWYESYELVMFTRIAINLDDAHQEATPFGLIHSNIQTILNCMAPYSAGTILNPLETWEFPKKMEGVGGKCLILDAYKDDSESDEQTSFGLLNLIEIFPAELKYAKKHGGEMLIEKLKQSGCYPYSDLDRAPVV